MGLVRPQMTVSPVVCWMKAVVFRWSSMLPHSCYCRCGGGGGGGGERQRQTWRETRGSVLGNDLSITDTFP